MPLPQVHGTIHSAFHAYQYACEERRQLAVAVGDVARQLTEVLCAVGWRAADARTVDVHELARVGVRSAWRRRILVAVEATLALLLVDWVPVRREAAVAGGERPVWGFRFALVMSRVDPLLRSATPAGSVAVEPHEGEQGVPDGYIE